jgi:hypothetical protein
MEAATGLETAAKAKRTPSKSKARKAKPEASEVAETAAAEPAAE